MKRAPFIGAGAAVLLAGCGGSHVMRALPGVASSTSSAARQTSRGTLVPVSADRIPDNVLNHPIIGEAWRFDGLAAPFGWMFAQGQTLQIADNPRLFSIFRTMAGGDGKLTFRLPNPGFGYIVAVAGLFPSSPTTVASSGRHVTAHKDQLGDGAVARIAMPKSDAARTRALADARHLLTSKVRTGNSTPAPDAPSLVARFVSSRAATRDTALSVLSPGNRAVLEAAVERVAAGASSLNDAVVEMTPLIGASEAAALLEAHDARVRQFRDRWEGSVHDNPQLEAARFAVSIAFSVDQLRRFVALQPQ